MWGGGDECGRWHGGIIELSLLFQLPRMTSTERNYLVPAQEKLEWVTPKISLMGAGETDGKDFVFSTERSTRLGPS